MERVYRSGLDVDVALATAARRLPVTSTEGSRSTAAAIAESVVIPGPSLSHDVTRKDLRGRVKRWLRRPVAVTFRLLKPFVRPLAFRTRRYLTEALHQDTVKMLAATQREVQRASAEVLREVQSAREMLRQEVVTIQAQATDEQRHLFAGLLQEQQTTRDQIRRLFSEGQRNTAQAYGSAAAQLLQDQQTTREQIRELFAEGQRNTAQAYGSAAAQLLQDQQTTREMLCQLVAEGQEVMAQTCSSATANVLAPRLDRLEQYGYASARRAVLPCSAGEMMVKTEAGYVMCSDSDLALLACLVDTGDLERGTRLLIENLLQPGDTFVDVGANVGMHTIAAGRALQSRGRIIAFEPFEATRKLLEKTIWINGLDAITEIHSSAVSDRETVQSLFLGASSGHHSLFALGDNTLPGSHVEVATVRLDSVLDPTRPVHLIKIDAEGAELEVLRGAVTTVRANPDIALIVEFGPSHLRRTEHSSAEWLGTFTDLGLEYRAIDASSGALGEITVAELEAAESTNLFFARPGAAPWSKTRKTA